MFQSENYKFRTKTLKADEVVERQFKIKMKNRTKKLITLGLLTFVLVTVPVALASAANHASGEGRLIAQDPPPSENGNAAKPGAEAVAPTETPAEEETVPTPDAERDLGNEFVYNLSKLFAFILTGISRLLLPIIMLSGALMKSDFLFSGTMNETLLSIWDQVRDIVNVLFVVLLIIVALYNVLGLGEAEFGAAFQLKKALPKIVLGLIVVNFSYLGVRLIVDVVNVGTTIAFSMPNATKLPAEIKKQIQSDNSVHDLCEKSEKYFKAGSEAYKKSEQPPPGKKGKTPPESKAGIEVPAGTTAMCENGKMTKKMLETISTWNIDGALPVMAVKFMNLQQLDKVAAKLSEKGAKISDLVLNMIVSIIMYFIYGISFIALFIVLLARAVMLWLLIVLSPLIAIQISFPQMLSKAGGGDYAGKIIKTLIAPIIIGFVLSLGFVIVGTMQQVDYSNTNLGSLAFKTDYLLTSNIDTFQGLLIALGTVVFIWVGVQGAVSDAIGGEIAGSVLSAAKQAGGWLAKAPFLYTPLFQVKSPEGHPMEVGAGALLQGLKMIPEGLERKSMDQARMLFGGGGIESELRRIMSSNGKEGIKIFNDQVKTSGTEVFKSKEAEEALKKLKSSSDLGSGSIAIKGEIDKILAAKDNPTKQMELWNEMIKKYGKDFDLGGTLFNEADKRSEIDRLLRQPFLPEDQKVELKRLQASLGTTIKSQEDWEKQVSPDQKNAYEQAQKIEQFDHAGVTQKLGDVEKADPENAKEEKEALDAMKAKVDEEKKKLGEAKIAKDTQQKIVVEIVDKSNLSDDKKAKVAKALGIELPQKTATSGGTTQKPPAPSTETLAAPPAAEPPKPQPPATQPPGPPEPQKPPEPPKPPGP